MSRICCLLTGLTDQPLDQLGHATPLQKARHPTLDALASTGSVLSTLPPTNSLQLETAFLALCGIDPPARMPIGPLEASFMGCQMQPGEIAYSLRFVSVGQNTVIDVADNLLNDQEGRLFCELLNGIFYEHKIKVIHLYGPRAVLITEHPELTQAVEELAIINPITAVGKEWHTLLPKPAVGSSIKPLIEEVMHQLKNHEINLLKEELEEPLVTGLLLNEGGETPTYCHSKIRGNFSRWALSSIWPSMNGVAKALGIEVLLSQKEYRRFDAVPKIIEAMPQLLNTFDTLILDIPYLWQSTYKGHLLEKLKTIEWVDKNYLRPISMLAGEYGHSLYIFPLRHSDVRMGIATEGAVPAVVVKPENFSSTCHPVRFDELAIKGLKVEPLSQLLEQGSVQSKQV